MQRNPARVGPRADAGEVVPRRKLAPDPTLRKLQQDGRLSHRDVDGLVRGLDEITGKYIDEYRNNVSKLTPRELDILDMIRTGRSSKQIADALGLSSQTVHKHRQSIRRKLQLDHREINLAAYLRSQ